MRDTARAGNLTDEQRRKNAADALTQVQRHGFGPGLPHEAFFFFFVSPNSNSPIADAVLAVADA